MTIKQRRIFYIFLIIIFLIISPFLILYSLGYRYNKEQNKFQKTGALYIRSLPSGANIIINDKRAGVNTPSKITSLLPGEYFIKVEKTGFLQWQKKLEVKSYNTTFAEDIYLFRSKLAPELINKGQIVNFSTAPARNKIIYTIQENADLNCYLFYFSSFKSDLIGQLNQIDKFIDWSPNEERILFQNKNNYFSIIDFSNQNKIIDLSQITNLRFNQLVWDEQNSNILWGVNNYKLYKINLLELQIEKITTPPILTILPTAEGHYFIYQNLNSDNLHLSLAEFKKFDSLIEISELPYTPDYQLEKYGGWVFIYNPQNAILYFLKYDNQEPLHYDVLKSIKGYSVRRSWLLFWNDYEYWIYDLENQKTQLIERLSTEIYNVSWHPEANYLIVETKNHLKIIEIDERDEKNIYNILNPQIIIDNKITFNPENKILVFVDIINDQEGIYYFQLQ